MARKPASKKVSISVDFEGVESGVVVPEDDYSVRVSEIEQKISDNSGEPYLAFIFEINDGPHSGKRLWHNCSLQPQALFNLRGVLEALGLEVPSGKMDLDIDDLIGLECGVAVQHETYNGKKKARIVEFVALTEEEETPPPKATKKAEEPAPAKKTTKKVKKIEVGSSVKFTDDEGNELEGEVTAIDGENATVLVDEDEWEIELSELTLA